MLAPGAALPGTDCSLASWDARHKSYREVARYFGTPLILAVLLQYSQRRSHSCKLHAALLDRSGVASGQHVQPAGKGLGFYTGDDGYLYVDSLRIDDIRAQVNVR